MYLLIFYVLLGTAMIIFWIVAFILHKVPEIQTELIKLCFHVIAEIVTAAILILGSFARYLLYPSSGLILFLGYGLLLYTLIQSTGYFAQKNQWLLVWIFLILITIHMCIVIRQIKIHY